MGDKKTNKKTPMEYVLNVFKVVSAIVGMFGVINIFSGDNVIFANQFTTTAFVIFLLVILLSNSLIRLLHRKANKKYSYVESERKLARYTLSLSIVGIILFSFFGYIYRPCLIMADKIPQDKFGILVANFTEGASRIPTRSGKSIALDILDSLDDNFYFSPLSDNVAISHVCAIRNEREANRAGESTGASMVIWGRLSNDVLKPEISLIDSPEWSANTDIRKILSPIFGGDVGSENLTPLSYRIETLTNLIVGLVYLDNAKGPSDYELANQSFSLAIESVYKDYRISSCTETDDRAIRRSLAILYTGRGRGNNGLKEPEKANADYYKAIECDDQYSSAYIGIGNIEYTNRNFSKAEIQYKKALALKPSASAYYSLANTRYYLGDIDTSIEYYKKAIEITESNGYNASDARLYLGETYTEIGLYNLAVEQYKIIFESNIATDVQKNNAQKHLSEIDIWLTASPTASVLRPVTTGTPELANSTATLKFTPSLIPTKTSMATPILTATLRPTTTSVGPPPPLRTITTGVPPTPDSCCKHCGPNSKPCGDACIPLEYVCHQPSGCACP